MTRDPFRVEATATAPMAAVDLLPAQLDMTLYAGDTLVIQFHFTDSAGAALDMSGTWDSHIRKKADDPDPPVEVFDIDDTDAAAGDIVATLTTAQTAAMLPGPFVWDLQQEVTGTVRTTHRGTITVQGDVTRP